MGGCNHSVGAGGCADENLEAICIGMWSLFVRMAISEPVDACSSVAPPKRSTDSCVYECAMIGQQFELGVEQIL